MQRLFPILILCLGLSSMAPGWGREKDPAWWEEQKEKGRNPNRYLIFGTVFNHQGLSLPGALIRVRRSGEKRVAAETKSDRRGEFAVRVAEGFEYEITVTAKGFQDAVRRVDARVGDREDLVFRMQALKEGSSQ